MRSGRGDLGEAAWFFLMGLNYGFPETRDLHPIKTTGK